MKKAKLKTLWIEDGNYKGILELSRKKYGFMCGCNAVNLEDVIEQKEKNKDRFFTRNYEDRHGDIKQNLFKLYLAHPYPGSSFWSDEDIESIDFSDIFKECKKRIKRRWNQGKYLDIGGMIQFCNTPVEKEIKQSEKELINSEETFDKVLNENIELTVKELKKRKKARAKFIKGLKVGDFYKLDWNHNFEEVRIYKITETEVILRSATNKDKVIRMNKHKFVDTVWFTNV